MSSSGSRAARRAGYTLIEIMVVVTIIGLSAIAFAPGISRATAGRRTSTAARELIRIGRRARADTFGYLRAHMVWIDPANGVVQVLRGTTNSCTLATAGWAAAQADCLTTPPSQRCPESLNLLKLTGDPRIYMWEEQLAAGNAVAYQQVPLALCYTPNGMVYWGNGANVTAATAALTTANNAVVRGGFVYEFHQGNSNTNSAPIATSRVHRVLFPLGGTARSLR